LSYSKISVLFEDEVLIAVNKPAGLPIHITLDPTRPDLQSLVEKQVGKTLVLFHRLDLETTGIVLLGKKNSINKTMTEMFMHRQIKKIYWAIVDGRWSSDWKEIKTFIAKAAGGNWANVRKGGAEAISRFRVLASNGDKTWVEVSPQTGRTHQIRLHCLERGHPILGDRRYGKAHPQGVPMALHARELRFAHPVSGEKMCITAPVPDHWEKYWFADLKGGPART